MDNLIHFEVEQKYIILFKKNESKCLTIDVIEVNNIDKTLTGKLILKVYYF